ncbi:MAG: hypothetical protein FWG14_08025 [Peptococcaceae bacterium]|nr:hypothetical protein [Peptococcaceae bacterium]
MSTPPLNLELANPVIGSMRQDENIDLDPDKKNLSFHIILTQPGDQRLITFQVENSSSLPARLQNLTGQDPPSTTGVYVVWPELDDVLLMPGAESPEYSILVIWDPSAFGAPAADITLHASLQYTQDAEGGR